MSLGKLHVLINIKNVEISTVVWKWNEVNGVMLMILEIF